MSTLPRTHHPVLGAKKAQSPGVRAKGRPGSRGSRGRIGPAGGSVWPAPAPKRTRLDTPQGPAVSVGDVHQLIDSQTSQVSLLRSLRARFPGRFPRAWPLRPVMPHACHLSHQAPVIGALVPGAAEAGDRGSSACGGPTRWARLGPTSGLAGPLAGTWAGADTWAGPGAHPAAVEGAWRGGTTGVGLRGGTSAAGGLLLSGAAREGQVTAGGLGERACREQMRVSWS